MYPHSKETQGAQDPLNAKLRETRGDKDTEAEMEETQQGAHQPRPPSDVGERNYITVTGHDVICHIITLVTKPHAHNYMQKGGKWNINRRVRKIVSQGKVKYIKGSKCQQ